MDATVDRTDAASALVEAVRDGSLELTDLTLLIASGYPCTWPGGTPFQSYEMTRYQNPVDPDYNRMVFTDEHLGTHMDAPAHYIPPEGSGLPHAGPAGSVTSDRVPLTSLIGPACVVDVSDLTGTGEPGTSPEISVERLIGWEARYGSFRSGDIVLFSSGWSKRYAPGADGRSYAWNPVILRSEPFWPGLSVAAMDHLVKAGVTAIGTEGGGPGAFQLDVETHHVGLGAGVIFIERLASLERLPRRGATFMFLPVHWAGGSAAPGRAVAFVPNRSR